MEKGRIAALDAGRAIAVVGVVAVHLSFQFPNLPHSVALIARMGQYGVQLFFVISAITIFMTLEADRERFCAARHITLRFYIKRFFRIAPLYYVAIAIYGLISWGALRSGYERAWVLGAHSPADILLNVLFLHALSPSAINNVVPGGWSIGVEMLFYLLAPLIFFFTLNRVRLAIASGRATSPLRKQGNRRSRPRTHGGRTRWHRPPHRRAPDAVRRRTTLQDR